MRTLAASVLLVALVPMVARAQGGLQTPYYPLKVGMQWVYRSNMQRVTVVVDKQETIIHTTKDAAGRPVENKVTGYSLKFTSGDKTLTEQIAVLADGVYRFQAAGKDIDPPLCFLKLSLNKGDSWKVNSKSLTVPIQGTLTFVGEETVKTPAGAFQAMHVRSSEFQVGGQPMEIDAWYVQNLGMVRQQVKVAGHETLLELEKAP